MPTLHVNGATSGYEEHGAGAETIVFAHGLLWSGRMFDAQVAALRAAIAASPSTSAARGAAR